MVSCIKINGSERRWGCKSYALSLLAQHVLLAEADIFYAQTGAGGVGR